MKKPLWNFFTLLKSKSPLILSLDQYHYFFMAWQQLPSGTINNHIQLRDYCKIFWLNNDEFEPEFDLLFESFIVNEKIREIFPDEKEKEVDTASNESSKANSSKKDITDSSNSSSDSDRSAAKPAIDDLEEEVKGHAATDNFVDFDLMISNRESQIRNQEKEIYQSKHTFNLNDQNIMPFKLRHFAQQLRRKVETSVKEVSDELDYEQMIQQYCEHRHIDEIVYQFKDSSSSNVVLMADRFGSMLAYEYLEDYLKESIKAIPDCHYEHYYFKNLPTLNEKTKHYEMNGMSNSLELVSTENMKWNSDTWIFIFSDAGAHSGMLNKGRMRATMKMWKLLKTISDHVYWFNPVPKKFMGASTSKRLQSAIPMIFPVESELNKFFNQV